MEEAGIIKGYKTEIDLEKIGLPLKAIIGFRINQFGNFKNFLKILETIPEVYECTRVTGKDCLFIKLAVKDSLQLENLIDRFAEYGETTTSIVLSSHLSGKVFKALNTKG
jgi:Lrp/AsnC family leucine-responsive transcriptional regulator